MKDDGKTDRRMNAENVIVMNGVMDEPEDRHQLERTNGCMHESNEAMDD